MTAGDLVHSACILAAVERGDGVELRILECVGIEPVDEGTYRWDMLKTPGAHQYPEARATFTFRDRHGLGRTQLEMKASTPLLFTRIAV
jgi:hypothetical protein